MSADPAEPSTRELLEEGLRLHGQRQFEDARRAYERALQREPNNADALHLLGVVALQSSRYEEAAALISRAVEIVPSVADFHNDLGCALRDMKDITGAAAAWQKAIELRPDFAMAYYNIADLLHKKGRHEEAIAFYTQTVRFAPDFANAYQEMSRCLKRLGRMDEAIRMMEQAVRICPDRPYWQFRLSAMKGDQSVTTMPAQIVRQVFDSYSGNFDDHLLGTLNYRGPKLLQEEVFKATDRTDLEILDLGCGTGLCGVEFRPRARLIVGVDLAPKMLKASEARGVYDRLVEADVLAALDSETQQYDLIVAGDVLIYVGDLTQFMPASARRLKNGGWLAFTVESYDGEGFHLHASSRFSHSIQYIRDLAAGSGLKEISARTAALRTEQHQDVPAWVVVLQKT
jgi:predicted TPR repeat methyltransferase